MKKRTVKSIPEYLTPEEMFERYILGFNEKAFTYRKTVKRAKALVAMLYATGLRVSDILRIRKDQLKEEEDFILIKNIAVSKRRKEPVKVYIPLPKAGVMEPFTRVIKDYAKSIRSERLFPITRSTAYKLVRLGTGQWCHYFRSQNFSYMVNLLKNPFAVARLKGVKNPGSLEPYYHTEWERHKEELLK